MKHADDVAGVGGHELAATLDAVCRPGAEAIAARYARLADVRAAAKPDGSSVTEADLQANRLITAGLRARFPEWPVVSEEDPDSHLTLGSDRYWLLDPLDGTREFLAGTGEFCTCVALVEGGVPVFGFISVPLTGESFYAWRGAGAAYAQNPGRQPRRRLTRDGPLARSSPRLRVGVSRHHRDGATGDFLGALADPVAVPMGSALKFCAIAEGRLDVYVRYGPTMHWDTAAGQCLLEAIGFGVRDLATGRPLRYDTPSRRNPAFLAGPFPP